MLKIFEGNGSGPISYRSSLSVVGNSQLALESNCCAETTCQRRAVYLYSQTPLRVDCSPRISLYRLCETHARQVALDDGLDFPPPTAPEIWIVRRLFPAIVEGTG